MKLYSSDNSNLLEVQRIFRSECDLIVEGVILDSMPIQAKLKPSEVRRALRMMSFGTLWFVLTMIFRGSR